MRGLGENARNRRLIEEGKHIMHGCYFSLKEQPVNRKKVKIQCRKEPQMEKQLYARPWTEV